MILKKLRFTVAEGTPNVMAIKTPFLMVGIAVSTESRISRLSQRCNMRVVYNNGNMKDYTSRE